MSSLGCSKLCKNYSLDWRERLSSRVWASKELHLLPAPSFQSSERAQLATALIDEEEQIAALQKQVEELRDSSNRKRAIIAPVRVVPPEIISRIFLYVASTDPDSDSQAFACDFTKKEEHPILRVCKQWRSVAFATPYLWSTIYMCGAHAREGPLKDWLSRSNGPLSIHYKRTVYDGMPDVEIWRILYDYIHRWKFFECTQTDLIQPLFSTSITPSILETLHLDLYSSTILTDLPKHSIEFPKLKELRLAGLSVPLLLSRIAAPQIHAVELRGCMLGEKDIFLMSQNLGQVQHLVMHASMAIEHPDAPGAAIIFPNLESVGWVHNVRNSRPIDLWHFFRFSTRLSTLSIGGSFVHSLTVGHVLDSIKNMTIECLEDFSQIVVPDILQMFPGLKDLELKSTFGSYLRADVFLEVLNETDRLLCPELQHLKVARLRADRKLLLALLRTRSASAREPHTTESTVVVHSQDITLKLASRQLLVSLSECRHLPKLERADYSTLVDTLKEFVDEDYSDSGDSEDSYVGDRDVWGPWRDSDSDIVDYYDDHY